MSIASPRPLTPPELDRITKRPGPRTVYVIGCERFVKIGVTRSIYGRLRDLQAANPFELKVITEIVGGYDIERQLHQQYGEYRHRFEWFRREGRLARWIDDGCPVMHVWDDEAAA